MQYYFISMNKLNSLYIQVDTFYDVVLQKYPFLDILQHGL